MSQQSELRTQLQRELRERGEVFQWVCLPGARFVYVRHDGEKVLWIGHNFGVNYPEEKYPEYWAGVRKKLGLK